MNLGTPTPADCFSPDIMRLLQTARRVIDQHINQHGNCADCGLSWPCQRAQLAEHALAALLTA